MKKLIVILTAFAVFLSSVSAVFAQPVFPDTKESDWYYGELVKAKELGIIAGFSDGYFRPNRKVTYGQFLRMVFRKNMPHKKGEGWAAGLYDEGIRLGYFSVMDFSKSQLDKPIPRKDMALIIGKKLIADAVAPSEVPMAHFSDVKSDDKYEYYISLCHEAGILKGYSDGSFQPERKLSRAQAAAAFVRLDSYLTDLAGSIEPQPGPHQKSPGSKQTAEELMDADCRKILQDVRKTVKFSGKGGRYSFSYSQPEIPEKYHLSVEVTIFSRSGEGTPAVYSYLSDEAYMTHPENYDPAAHSVIETITGLESINNKLTLCQISVRSNNNGELASLQLVQDFDGSCRSEAVWNPPAGASGSVRDEGKNAESYFEWE